MKVYLDALKHGKMDIETIDNLLEALKKLRTCRNYERMKFELSGEEVDAFIKN